ncbi:MAG: hypothetical protein K0Q76_3617 [Panacagrimonas sp.]|nr:hypothetical protein [Panacagrimonas sp.]
MAVLAATLSGCMTFGSSRLQTDQVDYARALAEAQKRQTLSNIVGLRYADPPATLPVSSVIAAYSFDGSANASASLSTQNNAPTTGGIGAGVGFSTRPTFTFTPITGEDYATAYIRPLAPSLVLPLIQSGVPIDVLFRLVVQSVGDLQNSAALSGASSAGDVGFFQLIQVLRRLQLQGMLTMRLESGASGMRVFMAMEPGDDGSKEAVADAELARRLLKVAPGTKEVEIVYGSLEERGARVPIITRSVTGMLTEVGAQIEVPQQDIDDGTTLTTVARLEIERRAVAVIHVGQHVPREAWISIERDGRAFWIDRRDFDSKFAFSVLMNLTALAQSDRERGGPVVTIPAY